MKKVLAGAVLVMGASASVQAANNIDTLGSLLQGEFADLTADLGAALSYKALTPAEPLGVTGFDIGIEVTATELQYSGIFNKASSGGSLDTLVVPKIHVHKGLPFGIDVGAFYSEVPNSNINLVGAELRYAIWEGGVASPALAVRGTYTGLNGVNQLDLTTKGLELTISKGLANMTPYAGVGQVWVDASPDASTGLSDESTTLSKLYGGLNFNMGLMNLAFEADKTGEAMTYGAKLGWRF